jgi:hypothetical protein
MKEQKDEIANKIKVAKSELLFADAGQKAHASVRSFVCCLFVLKSSFRSVNLFFCGLRT